MPIYDKSNARTKSARRPPCTTSDRADISHMLAQLNGEKGKEAVADEHGKEAGMHAVEKEAEATQTAS